MYFSGQAAPIKKKIVSVRAVCDTKCFLVPDLIEHVTDLDAHMAAAAA